MTLRRSFAIQRRVIGALVLREVITRYGRHNLGFAWLLLEPLVFTLGVIMLWTVFNQKMSAKLDVVPFAVTGYSSLLLWRICSSRGIKSIDSNRSLLHHRQVLIHDIFYARMLLDLAGVTGSLFLLIAAMMATEFMTFPADPLLLLSGWLFMCWFSACLGIILGCLSEHSDIIERLWHPVSYLMLPISGVFFMVEWLPGPLQSMAIWVPMVNAIEMIRGGYWGPAVKTYFHFSYIFFVCLGMTFIALALMSDRRMKMLT